ncbi:MAG: hypothetical protein QF707_05595, partial [Candidatus Poseidoniaceae archaeon]|nr:hypothetical protein [Candidatus Poseidoniaceae archaeon]
AAAMFSYLLLGGAMLSGMSWGLVMTTWVLVLITTDWLIFTFMAGIIEVSDPRIAATHMGVYQSVQAISSTTLMVLLGQLILKLTNDSYGTLYLLAAAGPLIGYLLFKEMRLSDSSQKNLNDVKKALVSGTDKMLTRVPGFDSLEGQRRSTMMAVAWGMIGLILVATVAASSTAMSSDYETSEESWSTSFNNSDNGTDMSFTLSPGDSDSSSFIHDGNAVMAVSVDSPSPSCSSTVGQVQYTIILTSPTELVEAGGVTIEEQGSGNLIMDDTTGFTVEGNFTAPSKEELQSQVDIVVEADNWSTGNGEWILDIERANSGPQNALSSCQFSVSLTLAYAVEPVQADFILNQTIETKSKDFGPAFIGAVGGPIILATPVLAWLVARPLED